MSDDPERMLADARVADAVEERRRRRAHEAGAEADARLADVLATLGETGGTVTVRTRRGTLHRGTVAAVGADHCALATPAGRTLLPFAAVTAVIPPRSIDQPPARGSRALAEGALLVDVLRDAAAERPRLLLGLDGLDTPLAGTLLTVGADVLSLRGDGDGHLTYTALAAVAEVVLQC